MKKNLVFLHVPKTAGTSMQTLLRLRGGKHIMDEDFDFEKMNHIVFIGSPDIDFMLRRTNIDKNWWKDSYKFAFVRNPWDRLVSCYHFFCRIRLSRDRVSNPCLKSWKTFIQRVVIDHEYLGVLKMSTSKSHFQAILPQVTWLRPYIDFIGKFENVNEDWAKLLENVGLEFEPLPHVNVSVHKPYREYYTKEIKDAVTKFYEEDIDTFKYTF